MRASQTILGTLRDDPGDAIVASHRLMLRAGLARKLGAGLYHFLPLGLRVMRKIEAVIREEMDAAGALEFELPILTPAELWQKSGRWDLMGKEMFRLKDRHDSDNVLGPTHEESFTSLMSELLQSYRDLPKNVYQIHTKFRDEIRPRFGVIRSREFVMKDAYSFDLDEAGLDRTYQTMRRTYRRIFARLGLSVVPVEADMGTMGGSASEEFMTPSEIGEETLLLSSDRKYRSNQEKTPCVYPDAKAIDATRAATSDLSTLERLHTPGAKTIDDVCKVLNISPRDILKTVVYLADGKLVAVAIRGDRDVNEVKLRNQLGALELAPADPAAIVAAGSIPGYIAPIGLKGEAITLWDLSLTTGTEWVIGANEKNYHLRGFVAPADRQSVDVALARSGDPVPGGAGVLTEMKGIEVGHIFKLGYKYSEAFKLSVLDANGRPVTPIMGCYGIGVNRTLATIIEQWHDEKGVRWPISVAPYEVCLVSIAKDDTEIAAARALYEALLRADVEVLWDDRDLRPGVKFTDAELIGYPIRLTMGKGYFQKGELEVQLRANGETLSFQGPVESLVEQTVALRARLAKELERQLEAELET